MELETLCIHGGKVDTDKSGAISTPIYQTATYAHPALGQSTGYDYTRDTNPTRDALEAAMAKLEGGSAALAFASGMAAATALMEMFSPGDHIVASDDLYGGSWRLFHRISMKNGLSFDWADTSDPEKTEALIRPETKAIFIETPTNPLMHVTDIRAIARIARRHRILLIVDNTFLSPVFQRPLVQPVVHLFQQGRHRGLQLVQGHDVLLPTQPGDQHALALFDVLRADLQTQGHPLHLILGKFPAWGLIRIIHHNPEAGQRRSFVLPG